MANHAALTGSELHEPKGADTATSGSVYTSDGAGSGNWAAPVFNSPVHGWGLYTDTGTSQVVGTTQTLLTNNKGTVIETYLPDPIVGSGTLWASNKLTPIAIGDTYMIRLDLPVTAKSGSPNKLMVTLDIGGTSSPTNVIVTEEISTTGTPPYSLSTSILVFSLTTFKANGMQVFVKADTGSVTILNPSILISRMGAV